MPFCSELVWFSLSDVVEFTDRELCVQVIRPVVLLASRNEARSNN